jgi:hypothetical protein
LSGLATQINQFFSFVLTSSLIDQLTEYTVNRKGENLETEYSVVPSPAQPTHDAILQAYKEKPINLQAFFTGGNPFEEADGVQPKSAGEAVDEEFANA